MTAPIIGCSLAPFSVCDKVIGTLLTARYSCGVRCSRKISMTRSGHELVYQSGNQLMTASYAGNGTTFVAEKPRVWIATLGGTDWDLAPDGTRVAVLIPEGAAQAPQQEHVIIMLQNFADELRRRVPLGK